MNSGIAKIRRTLLIALAACALLSMSACLNANGGSGSGAGAVGAGLALGSTGSVSPTPAAPTNTVQVSLGETSPTQMFITLSQNTAVSGDVTFQVTNKGTKTHEFVVLQTDIAADAFPVGSFEGVSDRINEKAPGVTNVGETGDMLPGTTKTLVINLKPGHYAVVCNLQHHYAMGMHADFTVLPKGATTVQVSLGETSPTQMFITLSQSTAVAGDVAFQVSNDGTKTHEFVVLQTDIAADAFPVGSFEGVSDRINEKAPGVTNVGETGDMLPGTTKTLVINLKPGHYAVVCNLQHHYAMGMHADFTVAAAPTTAIQVSLGETSSTQMFITLSQNTAVSGHVTFQVSNDGTKTHEFVVLRTDIAADAFPVVSFEGVSDRINEKAPGVKNVGETGDMLPGSKKTLVLYLPPGHYAVVCNLQHHYAMGMHADFTVLPKGATTVQVSLGETSPTQMFITLSQNTASSGPVTFQVSNDGTKTHEFVVLRTDTPAGSLPVVTFEGVSDRINEKAPGVTNVGETGDMLPGSTKTLVLNLPPGHYAVVCNLQHHYAMGMHADFTVS